MLTMYGKCPALSMRSFSSIVYKTSDEILVSETHFLRKFSFWHKGKSFINKFCGCFFLKTPKTRPINTAELVKRCIHSAGVEADIILYSRWLVRNVHCDWLKIAVRFLNATNRISPFWHTLKREISRCGPRDINVAQCSAIERGFPTMGYTMCLWMIFICIHLNRLGLNECRTRTLKAKSLI